VEFPDYVDKPALRVLADITASQSYGFLLTCNITDTSLCLFYVEKAESTIIGRIVVLADAEHVVESVLAHLGGWLGEDSLARDDDPRIARLPGRELEIWVFGQLEVDILVIGGAKPDAFVFDGSKAERADMRAVVDAGCQIPGWDRGEVGDNALMIL